MKRLIHGGDVTPSVSLKSGKEVVKPLPRVDTIGM